MEKPLTLKRIEFSRRLSEVINTAELPPLMVNDILIMVQSQVQRAVDEQTKKDIEEWKAQECRCKDISDDKTTDDLGVAEVPEGE